MYYLGLLFKSARQYCDLRRFRPPALRPNQRQPAERLVTERAVMYDVNGTFVEAIEDSTGIYKIDRRQPYIDFVS